MSHATDTPSTETLTDEGGRPPGRVTCGYRGWLSRRNIVRALLIVVVAFVLLNLPQNTNDYVTRLVTLTAITVLPVLSLTVLFGYAGQISLGQAAFYGLGAYIYANLTAYQGLSPWLALAVALVACVAVAYVLGRGLLRMRGYYLAMVSAAFGLIAASVFSNATSLTGGYDGITAIPPLGLFGFALDTDLRFYYAAVALALVAVFVARLLTAGEYGRVLRTVRESEVACAAFGVSVNDFKAKVFALSAGLAAFGGCLFAQYTQYVSPENFGPDFSIMLFLGAVIGGLGSPWGAFIGAGYVILLPELLAGHASFEIAITGVVTMVVILLAPEGLAGLVVGKSRRRRFAR